MIRKGRVLDVIFRHGAKKDGENRRLINRIQKRLAILDGWMATTGQRFGRYFMSIPGGEIELIVNRHGPKPVYFARGYSTIDESAVVTVPGRWLVWPASDDAPAGWGDPYTAGNAPLGSVRGTFAENANQARLIDSNGIVTHGVSYLAGNRDWRDASQHLVVSWDDYAIYNGGVRLFGGAQTEEILAKPVACVKVIDGAHYLVYLDGAALKARGCTVVEGVISAVSDTVHTASLTSGDPDFNNIYRGQFNDSATELCYVTHAGSPGSRKGFVVSVPTSLAEFSGTVAATLTDEAEDAIVSWVDVDSWTGSQKFLAFMGYKGDDLEPVYLTCSMSYSYTDVTTYKSVPDIVSNNSVGYWYVCPGDVGEQTWINQGPLWDYTLGGCSEPDPITGNDALRFIIERSDARWKKRFTTTTYTADVLVEGAGQSFARIIADYDVTTRGCLNEFFGEVPYDSSYEPGERCPGAPSQYQAKDLSANASSLPQPGDGFGAECDLAEGGIGMRITGTDTIRDVDFQYWEYPMDLVDTRFDRVVEVEKGYSSHYNQVTQTKFFKVGGDQLDGDFGVTAPHLGLSIADESELRSALKAMANMTAPDQPDNVVGRALNPTADSVVACYRAVDQDTSDVLWINQYSEDDILSMLSIDGETNPRVMLNTDFYVWAPALLGFE